MSRRPFPVAGTLASSLRVMALAAAALCAPGARTASAAPSSGPAPTPAPTPSGARTRGARTAPATTPARAPDAPPASAPATTPAPASSPAPAAGADGGVARSSAELLLAEADTIARQVAALRELAQRRPIAKGVLDRAQIAARLRERIATEYRPDELAVEARVLKRLGLVPGDADYPKMVLELLTEQVAGFYDPDTRKLYVASWMDDAMQRPALAHEIVHALQDQHFDLQAFSAPLKDDGDRQLARAALVEGDATAAMLGYAMQGMGVDLSQLGEVAGAMFEKLSTASLGSSPALEHAPRFLRDELTFPYFGGLRFVLALRKGAGWAAVDEVFKHPPESTEQVLHPEKYRAHEHPVAVSATVLAALAPARELHRDVLGEFEWKELLASHLDDDVAERAAAGWGGDRLAVYGARGGAGKVALVDLSTWDTEDEAVQLEAALRRWVAARLGVPEPAADAPAVWDDGAGESWSVERRGARVLLLAGVKSGARAAAAAEVWKSWRVGK